MPQVLMTNVASLNTQRALNATQSSLSTSLQRLSSGLRVNSAKDDAAGLAISERMSAQISGLDMARRNANDGVSLSQTAEGALGTIGELLNRMRDLAVQSANSTNSDADRTALNEEVVQLKAEIERIGMNTDFNGRSLLNGSFVGEFFQIGADVGQGVWVNLTDARASAMGQEFSFDRLQVTGASTGDHRFQINGVEINVTIDGTSLHGLRDAINKMYDKTGVMAEYDMSTGVPNPAILVLKGASFTVSESMYRNGGSDYSVNPAAMTLVGPRQSLTDAVTAGLATTIQNNVLDQQLHIWGKNYAIVDIKEAMSMKEVADKINDAALGTGVTATARTTATLTNLRSDGIVSFQLNGKNADIPVTVSANVKSDDLFELMNAINTQTDKTGITAVLSQDKKSIFLSEETGYDIKISSFSTSASVNPTVDLMGATGNVQTLISGGNDSSLVAGQLTFDSDIMFRMESSLPTQTGRIIADTKIYSSKVSVADINVNTMQAATKAIKVIDAAMTKVSSVRATLGALQNRFEAAIESLQANAENLSAARSRIRDTDFAEETSNLARVMVVQQAGLSMLSQANQLPNNVLSLLRT